MRFTKRVRFVALASSTLLALSGFVGVSQAAADEPQLAASAIIKVTDSNYKQVSDESRKRAVLFEAGATWCGWCKKLAPLLEKRANSDNGKWLLAQYDVDETKAVDKFVGPTKGLPSVYPWKNGALMRDPGKKEGFFPAVDTYIDQMLKAFGPGSNPTNKPTTKAPTTKAPTSKAPTTKAPSTKPTTKKPTGRPAEGAEPNEELIYQVSDSNYRDVAAIADRKLVIFQLSAEWCGWCKKLYPVMVQKVKEDNGKWVLGYTDTDKAKSATQYLGGASGGIPQLKPWKKGSLMNPPGTYIGYNDYSVMSPWVNDAVKAYGPTGDDNPTTKPATTKPATTKPATTKPATTKPATTKPATTKPATTKPATTKPATTKPAPTTSAPDEDGKLPKLPEGAVEITTMDEWKTNVLEESKNRIVIVDISKDKCGGCLELAPIMDEKYKEDGGAWQYARIDLTLDAFKNGLYSELGSPWFPTLIAFKDGVEVSRKAGFDKEDGGVESAKGWIDDVKAGKYQDDFRFVEVKSQEDWELAKKKSFAKVVIIRLAMDGLDSNRRQGEAVKAINEADKGKWGLANVDRTSSVYQTVRDFVGAKANGMPATHVIMFKGKARYEDDLTVLHQFGPNDTQFKEWLQKALWHHYQD